MAISLYDRALVALESKSVAKATKYIASCKAEYAKQGDIGDKALDAQRAAGAYAYFVADSAGLIGAGKQWDQKSFGQYMTPEPYALDAEGKPKYLSGSTVTLWKRLAKAVFVVGISTDSPEYAALSGKALANAGEVSEVLMGEAPTVAKVRKAIEAAGFVPSESGAYVKADTNGDAPPAPTASEKEAARWEDHRKALATMIEKTDASVLLTSRLADLRLLVESCDTRLKARVVAEKVDLKKEKVGA
jgi:hypothetical protein